jgi:hypothetical protein
MMQSKSLWIGWFGAVAAATAMAGCATHQESPHRHPSPDGAAAQGAGMMEASAMCDKHRKMMNGKSPEEKKAMTDAHMKAMSPDMQKKHSAMMEKCQ